MDNTMQEQQSILIVDDEGIHRKVLTYLLEEDYQLIIAKNGEQALQRLEENPNIDLVLLDVMMPGMNGYDVLKAIKSNPKTQTLMVIFITGLKESIDEEMGLRLGAVDYITKPFHPTTVKTRINNYLQMVHQRKLLEILAERDGLTEICNRRRFDELFQYEWQRSVRDDTPLSLIMLDVDCFKLFNDNYGHSGGDYVLKNVAKTLSQQLRRPADLVARYGGEEFVILLPNTDSIGAKSQAEEILKAITRLQIPHDYSEVSAFLSVSMGGVTRNNQIKSADELLKLADTALYQAKQQGRNRTVWQELEHE